MPSLQHQKCFQLALHSHQAGRLLEAKTLYQQIITAEPGNVAAHNNLGEVLRVMGRLDEAIAAYRSALRIAPNIPEIHNNLGIALKEQRLFAEAVVEYKCALSLRPDYPDATNNLAAAFIEQSSWEEAEEACSRALELEPDFAAAHNNLGIILSARNRLEEALNAYNRAIQIRPDQAESHKNLGETLAECGRYKDADAAFVKALELRPSYAKARFCRAMLMLLHGNFGDGWPLYEARLEAFEVYKRDIDAPIWSLSALDHRRILIYAEQGFGDAIQFVRYVSLVATERKEVIIECPQVLIDLFRSARGVSELVATGEHMPPFDAHAAMLSLPLIYQTRSESIPNDVPYLFADAERCTVWKQRLPPSPRSIRVGLVWTGSPKNPRHHVRDIPLRNLAALWNIRGVEFHSLQTRDPGKARTALERDAPVFDWREFIHDFADTAALMNQLDLIISVDTAVAHLAGALGRPVWTLLPFVPDWRWGLDSETTPWYPTMRLFRQPARGDWDSVIQRVAEELRKLAEARSTGE